MSQAGLLKQAGYLQERLPVVRSHARPRDWFPTRVDLIERGRQTVGPWPSGAVVDSLVAALRQAEQLVDDPEEKPLLPRAACALGSVSREVLTDVMAAAIKLRAGL